MVAAALQHYKAAKGEDAAKAAWAATDLQLPAFLFSVRPVFVLSITYRLLHVSSVVMFCTSAP